MLGKINKPLKIFSRLIFGEEDRSSAGADFVFFVHPRDCSDIHQQYPLTRYFPDGLLEKLMEIWPAVTISRITGFRSVRDGKEISGNVLAIPFTPAMMKKCPKLFRKRVIQAARNASDRGTKMIGLGGWIPSYTRYGRDLKRFTNGVGVTTGHAYAAWTIAYHVEQALLQIVKECPNPVIAIVGAAGSTGTLTFETLLERNLLAEFLLVETPKKLNRLQGINKRYENGKEVNISMTTLFSSLKRADIIVVVSNASGSLVGPEHIKPGAVVIDDSQPRNASEHLLGKGSVIDVLSHFPGLSCGFPQQPVKDHPEIIFTCLAETAILAANGYHQDFSIGRPSVARVKEIAHMAEAVGAMPATSVSFGLFMDGEGNDQS